MISGFTNLYYVGKSRRLAKKCFLTCAEPFLLDDWTEPVKLVLASVRTDVEDYSDLLEEYNVYHEDQDHLLDNLVYDQSWNELLAVNENTFKLDFLPYFCKTEHIHQLDLKVEGVLDKLIAEPNNCLHKRLKKYFKKNF
jgi:hypothetical protein